MNVVTYLINSLRTEGVEKVFLTLGLHIDPLVSELLNSDKVAPVICAHEAGAGFMAHGYSAANNSLGVASSIGGPGLANMIPALLSAKHDQRPLLIITGDVDTNYQHLQAFQNAGETQMADTALTRQMCKSVCRVESGEDFPAKLYSAITLAQSNPCGPVHLQIPRNIFTQNVTGNLEPTLRKIDESVESQVTYDENIASLLEQARQPLVYIGARATQQLNSKQLMFWLQHNQLPFISTIYARGFIPEDNPLFIGVAGFSGTEIGNQALLHAHCDALIVIGADISQRNFLTWHQDIFSTKRTVLLIDDKTEPAIAKKYSNIKWLPFSRELPSCKKLSPAIQEKRTAWRKSLQSDFESQHYLTKIQKIVGPNTQLFVDAGTAKTLASNYWQAHYFNSVVMSANTGSMGWALCAATGAALSEATEPVIAIVGDGSTRMLGVELSTAAQYNAPVLFLIHNNKRQQSVYDRMPVASKQRLDEAHPHINWTAFAHSLNVAASNVSSTDEIMAVLQDIWPITKPYLLDITIPESE